MGARIGADIGGTFTDLVLADTTGRLSFGKVLTTPEAPERAVLEGIAALLRDAAVAAAAIEAVLHGTTLFTNALIERRGARTALVTTRGFADAIEIGREHRYDMYDLSIERPAPIAPRRLRFEVTERVAVDGRVLVPLALAELPDLVQQLRQAEVEAVGVCLLHSYANPVHEEALGQALLAGLPDVALTLSSALAPEPREYERASTTLANVTLKPLAARYLGRLEAGLAALGIPGKLLIMASHGGLVDQAAAREAPIRLVESGPAGGALAAAAAGRTLGIPDLLAFDMGGTTAKATVIAGGAPLIAAEFEIDRRYRFKKGSGLPVKVATVEMIEIGTGGGSIARVDGLGRLVVGPESAGAAPGPAAYGRGGTLPTVTDADLVLGYLDPERFLGGAMRLDPAAAAAAIRRHVAEPLGLGLEEAAVGIHRLANEAMGAAASLHCLERGKDARQLPLFAFGGAGPVHAAGVAAIVGSPTVLYPFAAGVMSALGFLTAPMVADLVRIDRGRLDELDWPRTEALLVTMEAEARAVLGRSLDANTVSVQRFADLRYRKQGYEVRMALPAGPLAAGSAAAVTAAFERAYAELYGLAVPGAAIDAVAWRLVASGPLPRLLPPPAPAPARLAAAGRGRRAVWVDGGWRDLAVYDRYALPPGARLHGPALVEERESTVVLTDAVPFTIAADLTLVVERAAAG